jgi:hypothetical protein
MTDDETQTPDRLDDGTPDPDDDRGTPAPEDDEDVQSPDLDVEELPAH